jgi:prophage DNA circulation protein
MTYLTIITTALVITQIIRLIQNATQLSKQNKLIKAQLKDVEDITTFDIQRQRKMHDLVIAYLEQKIGGQEDE